MNLQEYALLTRTSLSKEQDQIGKHQDYLQWVEFRARKN